MAYDRVPAKFAIGLDNARATDHRSILLIRRQPLLPSPSRTAHVIQSCSKFSPRSDVEYKVRRMTQVHKGDADLEQKSENGVIVRPPVNDELLEEVESAIRCHQRREWSIGSKKEGVDCQQHGSHSPHISLRTVYSSGYRYCMLGAPAGCVVQSKGQLTDSRHLPPCARGSFGADHRDDVQNEHQGEREKQTSHQVDPGVDGPEIALPNHLTQVAGEWEGVDSRNPQERTVFDENEKTNYDQNHHSSSIGAEVYDPHGHSDEDEALESHCAEDPSGKVDGKVFTEQEDATGHRVLQLRIEIQSVFGPVPPSAEDENSGVREGENG